MKKDVQCLVCNSPFVEPVSLECGHSFCFHCIKHWIAGKEHDCECRNCVKKCPKCRAPIDKSFRTYIESIVALREATKSIVECAGDDEEKEDYRVRERECLDYKAAVALAQVESFCLTPPPPKLRLIYIFSHPPPPPQKCAPTRSTRAPVIPLSLSSPNSNQCRKASKRAIGMFFRFVVFASWNVCCFLHLGI